MATKNVEFNTYIDSQRNVWFRGGEVALAFGYRRVGNAIKAHVSEENKERYSELSIPPTSAKIQPTTIFINEDGLKQLIIKSRMPKAADIAKRCGVDVYSNKVLYKEQESVNCITKAFRGENMLYQHTVGDYRIDLYFPDYKLAIECDELDHVDRDLVKEIERQKYLESRLSCKFIRYNPDSPTFDVFDLINEVYTFIKHAA